MKVKESKEVVVAKITTRQVVIVAVISLFSAVGVAFIANFDKLVSANSEVKEEVGYYKGRASNVEHAFHETEEALQARRESAQTSGKLEEANHLKELTDEVRAEDIKFQERHSKHIEAIKNGKRLDASEIKTEANEAITKLNFELYIFDEGSMERSGPIMTIFQLRKELLRLNARRALNGSILALTPLGHGHIVAKLIPLYGKGNVMQGQEQVCEIKKNSGYEESLQTIPSDWGTDQYRLRQREDINGLPAAVGDAAQSLQKSNDGR